MENIKANQLYTLYKPLLFSLAYRMMGSVMDAEDIVQEAFLTIYKSGSDHIQNIKAYLCKIVTNRCLELLRSTSKQREVYAGTWLPEPLVATASDETDPIQSYLQKESVSTAYLLLLQQLSYVERAVFLLREAMQYDYEEIAGIVGKSSTNCRQIFHRAKRSLNMKPVPDHVDDLNRKQTTGLVEQFMHAFAAGDVARIMKFLSVDAILFTDGGGKVQALAQPVHGLTRISNLMMTYFNKFPVDFTYRITMVNGLLLSNDTKVSTFIKAEKPDLSGFFIFMYSKLCHEKMHKSDHIVGI
ncbi:sigma-70 family RNA polymerase sigma factor [Paenibacillus sp. Dod16]|uniref:sigma-70 family RNA polymerase sigma factor n=1 Tax=Paenibacillus sp. Dod16 TaxID=3416392 RepID=UPI003CF305D0